MQVYLMAVNPRLALRQPAAIQHMTGAGKPASDAALDEMVSIYAYRSIDGLGGAWQKAAGRIRNMFQRH